MRCPDFETRLNDVLDNRQPPEADRELLAHVTTCVHCSHMLQSYVSMLAGFQRLKTPAVSPHFATSVVQATLASGPVPSSGAPFSFTEDGLEPEFANASLARPYNPSLATQRPARFFQRAAWGAIASCAAALLLFVALRLANNSSPKPTGPQGNGNAIAITQPGAAALPPGSTLAKAPLPEPNFADGSLTHVSYGSYDEYRSALTSFSEQFPQAVEHLELEDVDTLAPGIRPIRASFSTAIDTLRRTIPKGSREQRQLRPATGALELSSDCWA